MRQQYEWVAPRGRWMVPMMLVAAVALAGCTSGDDKATDKPAAIPSTLDGALPDLVERVEPSVVTIVTGSGLGSGVVYRGGVIVTNAHVVGQDKDVQVVLADESRVPGVVAATDTITDLAVVKTQKSNLPAATFQQALPRQGSFVMAIGSPLGLSNTVTTGVVSGLNRQIPGSAQESRAMVGLIQTDAAISPGNSGGALLNGNGQVVGVNEAYIPPQAGAVSLGFAIPAATVVSIADQLLATGTAQHPYLGIVPDRVTAQVASSLKLPNTDGVLVRDVAPGGPAAAAGLRAGDVITGLNGQKTRTLEDFLGVLRTTKPGDSAQVEFVRGGQTSTVTVTVGTLPASG